MFTENFKSNGELRFIARQQLKGNWGVPILICLLFSVIVGAPNIIPFIGGIATLIITGPMMLGQARYFIGLRRGFNPQLEVLFDGFKLFTPALVLQLLMGLFIFLWSLLLIVPGIIAALNYSQAFYILNDNPNIRPMDALRQSKEMMNGYKGRLFMLYLSFIGWAFLCALTLGIGFLWLNPYIQLSAANFYDELRSVNDVVPIAPPESILR